MSNRVLNAVFVSCVLAVCLFSDCSPSLLPNNELNVFICSALATFHDLEIQPVIFLCLGIYFATFVFIHSRTNSIFWLAGVLLISAVIYVFNYPSIEALTLLAGASLG